MNLSRTLLVGGCLIFVGGLSAQEDREIRKPPPEKQPPAAKPQPANPTPAHTTPMPSNVDEFFNRFDKNKNDSIERDELPTELRARFDELDLNKDGKLSRDEVRKHVEQMKAGTGEAARTAKSMEWRATVLQFGFRVMTSESPELVPVQMVYDLLRGIDANKDGKISRQEMNVAVEKFREHRVEAILERQGDKDGRISKANARFRVKRNFDRWDLNKDGVIDRNELRQAFQLTEQAAPSKSTAAPVSDK
ncbi:MAG: EF-hand domain-containing protein [Gemmataceae bacterium]|nr:EF-hand domain-containing protein [Gemmataceae bacterium]